jgi:hypothetical protein
MIESYPSSGPLRVCRWSDLLIRVLSWNHLGWRLLRW